MTATEAHQVVRALRRQFLTASVSRAILLIVVALGLFATGMGSTFEWRSDLLLSAAVLAGIAWLVLTVVSIRQIRAANQASGYIASGRLDLAEEQLKSALRQFSLYRNGKLLACHNLAVVAHGRKNYQAAAELCDGVISLRGGLSGVTRHLCRILLADCRLFLGDIVAARRAIEPMSLRDPALGLAEQMLLLPVELRCQIADGEYEKAASSLAWKVGRAELLDSPKAALTHALLAIACREVGRRDTAAFLERRAGLYHDAGALADEYETLRDSHPSGTSADNK